MLLCPALEPQRKCHMTVSETCSNPTQNSVHPVLAAPLKRLSNDGQAISGEDVPGGVGPSAAEERESRVEELRREVQNGAYHVDVHEVSKKIVDEHRRD